MMLTNLLLNCNIQLFIIEERFFTCGDGNVPIIVLKFSISRSVDFSVLLVSVSRYIVQWKNKYKS